MKKLILILLLVLVARLPLGIWNGLTQEEKLAGVQSLASTYCEQESCHKVKISIASDEEFVYFRLECLEKIL